jgi:RNA polymerase-binding protein DksA
MIASKADAIRATLVTRRDELAARLRQLNQTVRAGLDKDSEERAVEIANDDVRARLIDEGEREMREIAAALARLDAGSYGLCAGCGKPIAAQRLAVYPTATHCIDCAQRI